jgi:hypothetical protein
MFGLLSGATGAAGYLLLGRLGRAGEPQRVTAFWFSAALAVLVSLPEGGGSSVIPQSCMALGAIGLLVSVAFSAQEARAIRGSGLQTDPDAAAYTTSSIYLASAGFFAFIVLISTGLLFVR